MDPQGSHHDWVDQLSQSLRQHEKERAATGGSKPRYEVLDELGRGGMGIVYRAWDPGLGRQVALKVLLERGGNTPEARERFLREAQLAARLYHPHIIPVYDTGEWDGQIYLSMPLIEGATADRAGLDLRKTLEVVRDAALALDYAHREGIVHRDVKPSNLIVDRSGRVYVTDFGLARATDMTAKLTLSGTILGTPSYMSPEQARGQAAEPRSDLYSLGATLYELLTGRAPFLAADPMVTLNQVISEDPVAPRQLKPELPRAVETLVLKAMDKDPAKRYATGGQFAEDLQRYLDGEPIRATRPGLAYRLRKALARHPWRTVGVGTLVVALTLGSSIGAGYLQSRAALRRAPAEPDRHRRLALLEAAAGWFPQAREEAGRLREELIREREERARKEEKEKADKARAEKEALALKIRQREELDADVKKCRELVRELKLEDAEAILMSLKRRDPALPALADLAAAAGEARFRLGVEKLAAMEEGASFDLLYTELLRGADAARKARVAESAFLFAKGRMEKGRHAEAVRGFTAARDAGLERWQLYESRGLAYLERAELEKAREDYAKFLEIKPPGTPRPPAFARLFHLLGQDAAERGEWTRSRDHLKLSIEILPAAESHHDLGRALFKLGDTEKALDELNVALGLKGTLAPHRDYAEACRAYSKSAAERAWKLEDRKARREAWQTAVRWLNVGLEAIDRGSSPLLLERARMRRRLREYDAALEDARKAADSAESFLVRGQIEFVRGRYAEAARELERAGDAAPAYWRAVAREAAKEREGVPELLARAGNLDAALRLGLLAAEARDGAGAVRRAGAALEGELSEDEYVALLGEHEGISSGEALQRLRRDAWLLRARGHFLQGAYGECVRGCDQALALDGRSAAAHYRKGYALYRQRDYKGAVKEFRETIFLTPDDAEARIALGSALHQEGNLDDAIASFTDAIAIDGKSAEAYAGRGKAKEDKRDRKGALEDYRKAYQFAPPGELRDTLENLLR